MATGTRRLSWLIVCRRADAARPRSPSRRPRRCRRPRRAPQQMTEAARALLAALDDAQRKTSAVARSTRRSARTGRTCRIKRITARGLRLGDLDREAHAARARPLARLALEPGVPESRRHHPPRRHQSRAAGRALAARRDSVRQSASRELRLRQLLRPVLRRSADATRAGAGSFRVIISPSASRSPTARRPSCRCSSARHRSPSRKTSRPAGRR